MAVASLVVAILAFLVALASILWNVQMFVLSGPRGSAQAVAGVSDGSRAIKAPTHLMIDRKGIEQIRRQQGGGEPIFGIEVTNTGRMPLWVASWSLTCERSGIAYLPGDDTIGPKFPCKVEPKSSEVWFIPLEKAVGLAGTLGNIQGTGAERIIVAATTGDSQSIKAPPVSVDA